MAYVKIGRSNLHKKEKSEVDYRIAEVCETCDYYRQGECDMVKGNVSPKAVCTQWSIDARLPSGGLYGDFYMKEYEKAKEKAK